MEYQNPVVLSIVPFCLPNRMQTRCQYKPHAVVGCRHDVVLSTASVLGWHRWYIDRPVRSLIVEVSGNASMFWSVIKQRTLSLTRKYLLFASSIKPLIRADMSCTVCYRVQQLCQRDTSTDKQ